MASDALISLVVEQLVSYAQQQVTLVTGAREEVGKLSLTLKIIQGVVADAEVKQVQNSAVKVWLAELRDVIYAADDILDEWQTRTTTPDLHLNTDSGTSSSSTRKYNKVLSLLLPFCHCFKDVSVRYDIGLRIKEIRERLDVIAKAREEYALVPSDSHNNEPTSITPLTSSIVDASEIRGRDHDKQIMMDMLLGHSSLLGLGSVHVISIVATGGFGKTTLAKLVFNEEKIKSSFEKRMWVCVSQPFDLPRIAKEIIEQAIGYVSSSHGWEALHQHLSNSVKGKRFLLILDDVWTNDFRDWEPLKLSLSDGAPGSRIVLTTRNREVAMLLGSTCIHDLRGFSEEDSWSLLSHVALRGREQDRQKFETIGKEIAFKCKGVPLAIQTLASLLFHKRSIQDWRDVANSNLWEISQIKDFFLPSLFISYYSLPSISKQCFLYCSVFPKDHFIRKSELVELWMAQGFLGYGRNRELEKIGGTHFDVLAMSSFFQDFTRDSDGMIVGCKMHDLVHDFAQFLSQGECFNGEGNDGEFDATKIRHLLINHNDSCIYEAQNLRTYMELKYSPNFGPTSLLYGKLLYLRTLNLRGSSFEELPSVVNKLLHLRYINLSFNRHLTELPDAICNLINLQTLRLDYCNHFCKLPERIGDLSNLRHLGIHRTKLTYLPQGIKRLIFLRRLSTFIVGGLNGESKLEDLAHLRKLQEDLHIVGLGRITDANEAAQAGLNEKKALDDLKLEFTNSETVNCVQISTMNSVLERLKPPEYLKHLSLIEYPGDQFSSWMHDSSVLSNLVSMILYKCINTTHLPALGNLESLGELDLLDLDLVKHVGREFFGGDYGLVWFPKLWRLRFANMIELEQWEIPSFSQEAMTSRVKVMPNLCGLTVVDCPKLRVLPDISIFKSLETLFLGELGEWVGEEEEGGERRRCICLNSVTIRGCDKLKVIPHSMFSPSLRKLDISDCPGLRGKQPYLPPLLEKLFLTGDAGVFSESLPLNNQLSSSINYFSISNLPHSSLPNGVSQLKALQTLLFQSCETLDFDLKDLQQFTMLQFLKINECPILHECFQGEGWRSILSHVSNITLNDVEIKKSD